MKTIIITNKSKPLFENAITFCIIIKPQIRLPFYFVHYVVFLRTTLRKEDAFYIYKLIQVDLPS